MTTSPRQFAVKQCLGKGGFGEVYLAEMSRTGGLAQMVALKVLREDVDPKSQAVQRLRDEAKMLAKLEHPSILKVHDLVMLEGRVTLVTEYIAGFDLDRAVTAGMPVKAVIDAVGQIAEALEDALLHMNIVHRDIKPANIRVSRAGTAKLLDFGIASTDEMVREARTQTDIMIGSPGYMSLERFTGEALPESDVYALGVTLWESLTRDRFFDGMGMPRVYGLLADDDKYAKHLEAAIERLFAAEVTLGADIAEDVGDLLLTMLARDAADRFHITDVCDVCDAIVSRMGPKKFMGIRYWARYFKWPAEAEGTETGPLDGRTLTEGSVVRTRDGNTNTETVLFGRATEV